jgi:5-formyltetrahydrofolate cyclo-ligase
MISSKKQLLRAKMKKAVSSLPERSFASKKLRQHLHRFSLWKSAKVVFGFTPLREEPDWMGEDLPVEKIFAYPRAGDDGTLVFLLASEFQTGALGVREPVGATMAPLPDLVLVPGLAFDITGARLGRGKGFYDRWLAANPSVRSVGICFRCQIVESLPFEAHDARVSAIVSEEGILVP